MPAATMLLCDNSTDARFRAWGSWISAQLAASGWVKTDDAGPIDWAMVTRPTTANEVRGYEIWRMNDALEAEAPVLLKIEYGSGANNGNQPCIWITVGGASNGTGSLVGVTSTRTAVRSYGTNGTDLQQCIASGGPGRFQCAMFFAGVSQHQYNAWWLSIERTKNASGRDTTEGVLIASATDYGTSCQQQYYQNGAGPTPRETSLGVLLPTFGAGSTGASVAIYPVFWSKGVFLNPGLGIMVAFLANVSAGTTLTFTVYGSPRTYFVLGPTVYSIQRGSVANPITLLLRYE